MFNKVQSAQFLVLSQLAYFVFADLFRLVSGNSLGDSKVGIVVRVVAFQIVFYKLILWKFFLIFPVFDAE